MKKNDKIEISYVKKSYAMFIALFCFAAGFAVGIIYDRFDRENSIAEKKSEKRNRP